MYSPLASTSYWGYYGVSATPSLFQTIKLIFLPLSHSAGNGGLCATIPVSHLVLCSSGD